MGHRSRLGPSSRPRQKPDVFRQRLARHETHDRLAFVEPGQPDLENSMTRDQLQIQLDKCLAEVPEGQDELLLGRSRIPVTHQQS
jgi:hypothetical protein